MGESIFKSCKKKVLVASGFFIFGVISNLQAFSAKSQEMPSGASVASGSINITGTGTNHLIIDQKTNKSIINWDSFTIHSGGRVDFNQPSAQSFSLNRVNGSTPSSIAGQLNSNGKVMLINPNGVVSKYLSTIILFVLSLLTILCISPLTI